MEIQAFGYLGVGTSQLDEWTSLATRGLGMEAIDRGAGIRAFRMDDRRQRLVLDNTIPNHNHYFGWEVANSDALDALGRRLEKANIVVRREPTALADQRFVSGLISFHDPAGNRLEAFYGAAVADTPFRPGRLISGFRAGPLGMGHVLLVVQNITAALAFYRDLLGFRISDYVRAPVPAYFLHVNPRHHSLALVEAPVNAINHLMVELYISGRCWSRLRLGAPEPRKDRRDARAPQQ
jgi:2,3-dihydroxybiphenyl 1,2-dioxygenase